MTQPVVRILAGVAGRSLPLMVGMAIGAMEALAARRTGIGEPLQPVSIGVSGGAIAAAAIALGMTHDRARRIAAELPEANILGEKSLRSMLTRRTLYPRSRMRDLAHAIVGDRTFADFALNPAAAGRQTHESSLLIPVFSAEHGTLLLPRDLPKLGLSDLRVADALVAATRIPGALPAAAGLEGLFDGGCQFRVPHEIFSPHPALVLDLYGPQPYDSRGGLIFPLLHPSLPVVRHRPRPFHDAPLRESTIFAHQPYGAALRASTRSSEELFDNGYDIVTNWIGSRTDEQLLSVVDPEVLGLPTCAGAPSDIRTIA